ncbi:MAG: tRNA uridine-5-carboxymethylaminomethyl(34) synthesis GTPase MnmE [Kiritimatiellae bacterium]|nr:tRNA uridine-5-carboxymethylaminomethyl(34) synthesis GTPase MnmE [Kiritimatiellia bacterium]MDD5522432.1 tRNA uridine-5-carboxymethylaminomethyl(34) synthesis GTPase MnmE [Kiritimatiellia bacterium]
MEISSDTIAAIATAPGEAGIAIVRISGPASLSIADRIFKGSGDPPSKRQAGTFLHGFIRSSSTPHDADADETILLIYRAPHSYTREDVIEIQGHGGRTCAKRILRAVLEAGARPAEPGEFTKRAFLNGRIDLLQAEAVADLIMARSDRAASAAIEQLEGSLSSSFSSIYDCMINAAADLEASLDFPEEDLPSSLIQGAVERLRSAKKQLDTLLATWEEGHLLREGALVVISGKPNVGKSTLLNSLLGTNRAIVTDEPGTTRDTIEEEFVLDGVSLRLVDTAGLRDSDNVVEREGVQRAHALINKADLNIMMYDAFVKPGTDELKQLMEMDPCRCIVVLNKTDLGQKTSSADFPGFTVISSSLLKGTGIAEIRAAIIAKLGIQGFDLPHATISERHRHIIQNVLAELNDTLKVFSPDNEDLLVPAISTLRTAIEQLGTITGKNYDELLLENIFRRFCIGK